MLNIFDDQVLLNITREILSKERKTEALCNEVYLINAQNGKFIVKIAEGDVRKEELDKEYKLINSLNDKIALPKIYLYKIEDSFAYFVMEYIEGSKPTKFTDNILKQMAESLKNIHQLNATNKEVDFDTLIKTAEQNMIDGRLDLDEFIKDVITFSPDERLEYLKENKPKAKACLLHGDYRPKNMLIKDNMLYILDWGLSFVGDIYYDFAIIKWYFSQEEFDKFIEYYGIKQLDKQRLEYNEWLSAFLNV